MHISVEELSKVDRKIHIKADKGDLTPKVDQALKKIRRQANIPGFRPGTAPMGMIEKRFRKEVEQEEASNLVNDILRDQIYPEHKPIGQPIIEDFHWHDDHFHASLLIAVKPEITLVDLKTIEVDRLVHDVTNDDIEKEIESALASKATYSKIDGPVSENCKLVVHSQEVDALGASTGADLEMGVEIDFSKPGQEHLLAQLKGHKVGEKVTVTYDEDENAQRFELEISSIEKRELPDLTDAFVDEFTVGAQKTVDEYRSDVKSRVQAYFDDASKSIARDFLAEKLVNAHSFEIPKLILNQIASERLKTIADERKTTSQELANDAELMNQVLIRAEREAKWMFLYEEILAKYTDLKVTEEDLNAFYQKQALQYGFPWEMLKNLYAERPETMDRIYNDVAEQKLFNFLLDEVTSIELSREAYQAKYNKK